MAYPANGTPIYGPRPYGVTGDDHRGIVLTMTILFMIYASMVLAMRLIVRHRNMGVEDWLSLAATSLAFPQFITILVATVDAGFGASYALLSSHDTTIVARCIRTADVFFLLALFISKCSVIWFCRRLFTVSGHKMPVISEMAMGVCGTWCLGSILGVTVGCDSVAIIHAHDQKCANLVSRWAAVGSLDAVLEICILVLAVGVISTLQMTWHRKLQASMCFLLRLPIIVLIGLNIKYVVRFNSASNAGMALVSPVLFRQAELFYALLSAAIPSLNQYLRKFDTTQATVYGYRSNAEASRGNTYQLESMSNGRSRNRSIVGKMVPPNTGKGGDDYDAEAMGKSTSIRFNPTGYSSYQAHVEGPPNTGHQQDGNSTVSQEDVSTGRAGSEDHIIHKDVVYEVRHEY